MNRSLSPIYFAFLLLCPTQLASATAPSSDSASNPNDDACMQLMVADKSGTKLEKNDPRLQKCAKANGNPCHLAKEQMSGSGSKNQDLLKQCGYPQEAANCIRRAVMVCVLSIGLVQALQEGGTPTIEDIPIEPRAPIIMPIGGSKK